MPVNIIKKKKPAAKQTPQQKREYQFFGQTLGPARLAIVDSRLLNDETAESIAKTIKGEWKLYKNTTLRNVARRVSVYKRLNVIGKLKVLERDKDKKGPRPRLSDFADKVDVLENLTKLVELQQTRVSKAIHHESTVFKDMLDRKTRFELELLGNLYVKLGQLQMDLGLLRKVPQKVHIEGMASRTQQLLEQAMQKSSKVDMALSQAFAVLDGKFSVVSDDAANKH